MISLQQLFGRDKRFFDLLQQDAEETRTSVKMLVKLLQDPEKRFSSDEFAQTRRKGKRITQEIYELVCKEFITPLEREDILALSNALYLITKTAEKFVEYCEMCPEQIKGIDFTRQAEILGKATDTLCLMVEELCSGKHIERIQDQNSNLQYLEGEADKIGMELLEDLYNGKYEPLRAMALKDLYDILECMTDRCRDAGLVILHVVFKNS